MHVASVDSGIGGDIEETNISISGSSRNSQKRGKTISKDIKEIFRDPGVRFIHYFRSSPTESSQSMAVCTASVCVPQCSIVVNAGVPKFRTLSVYFALTDQWFVGSAVSRPRQDSYNSLLARLDLELSACPLSKGLGMSSAQIICALPWICNCLEEKVWRLR